MAAAAGPPLPPASRSRSPRRRCPCLPLQSGKRCSGSHGLPQPPGLASMRIGGERACSSGELLLSLSHSIFLPLVKPLYVATSIIGHDSCCTPFTAWSLALLDRAVNRFAFLKQITCFFIPPRPPGFIFSISTCQYWVLLFCMEYVLYPHFQLFTNGQALIMKGTFQSIPFVFLNLIFLKKTQTQQTKQNQTKCRYNEL